MPVQLVLTPTERQDGDVYIVIRNGRPANVLAHGDGLSVLNGTVDPTDDDGVDGEFWINTTDWTIFGPKDGTWPDGVNMLGDDPDTSVFQLKSEKNAANGYAGLNANGKVPRSKLPGYTDDVLEYDELADFPVTGTSGKLYIALDTSLTYFWDGDSYELSTATVDSTDTIPEGTTNLYYTDERARDAIAAALTAGTGITVTPNDGSDTITIASTVTQYTDEMARDALGAAITAGTGISVTPSDVGDTITIASTVTQYTDEMARDALGAALTAGTGITITPNDGSDTITIASSITQYTDEMARDALGTALTAGSHITITPNDGSDTITIAHDGTGTTGSAGDSNTNLATNAFVDATLYATDNAQSGTTYTLVLADYRKEISLTHATGCAVTIPTNASVAFPVGTRIAIWNDSAGTHTIVGASGVTLNGISGGSRTGTMTVNASGVRGGVLLRKIATNAWTVTGAIGAVA